MINIRDFCKTQCLKVANKYNFATNGYQAPANIHTITDLAISKILMDEKIFQENPIATEQLRILNMLNMGIAVIRAWIQRDENKIDEIISPENSVDFLELWGSCLYNNNCPEDVRFELVNDLYNVYVEMQKQYINSEDSEYEIMEKQYEMFLAVYYLGIAMELQYNGYKPKNK